MFDNDKMLELIERAVDDDPYCSVCGAATTITDDDGRLWLTCSATTATHGVLARIGAAVRPHERRLVVDLRECLAA
jgi:hypothetical protein